MPANSRDAWTRLVRSPILWILVAAVASASLLFRTFGTDAVGAPTEEPTDSVRKLQNDAIAMGKSAIAHWGSDPNDYDQWTTHTNRLVPLYTFGTLGAGLGIDLDGYLGARSPYRAPAKLERLYGRVLPGSLNRTANYVDQTNVYDLQHAALEAGKRHIFLVIFDGMGWEPTRAAAILCTGKVYAAGRGAGLHLLDYQAPGKNGAATTQFGLMVTAPFASSPRVNVDTQSVGAVEPAGGYDAAKAGATPWASMPDPEYVKGESTPADPYTDSASSAVSMTAGIKTFNGSINIAPDGRKAPTIARQAQRAGYAVGVVTSVPISHATPASAYAHNVSRSDYQDLTRDLLGLPSIGHPGEPLPGLDVAIGAGQGVDAATDDKQGTNFVPGNRYVTDRDLATSDISNGGRYVVRVRSRGVSGAESLQEGAKQAAEQRHRLFGLYGTRYSHLPYATANGDYRPANDRKGTAEGYSNADLTENPTLTEMTGAALTVLAARSDRFWLMVEAGDVDFAEHNDNLDTMVGAIFSGDQAVKAITDWVEANSDWDQAVMIVTADHDHYLVLDDPQALARLASDRRNRSSNEASPSFSP